MNLIAAILLAFASFAAPQKGEGTLPQARVVVVRAHPVLDVGEMVKISQGNVDLVLTSPDQGGQENVTGGGTQTGGNTPPAPPPDVVSWPSGGMTVTVYIPPQGDNETEPAYEKRVRAKIALWRRMCPPDGPATG